MHHSPETYVLTLKLDPSSFDVLQAWRQLHFPRERNFLPAHLTLFHTLQPGQVDRLRTGWPGSVSGGPVILRFTKPKLLGAGVAIEVESPTLSGLRRHLMEDMSGGLTRQDQQSFRAHVTLQNKVPAADARRLFDAMNDSFASWDGSGTAILIWRYLGGPWALDAELDLHCHRGPPVR